MSRAEWPPEGVVFPISRPDLRVSSVPHPYHLREASNAAANWLVETAANPALFDGQILFQREVSIVGESLSASGHMVPFSTFLWWRKSRSVDSGYHLFGLPLIVSADGGIIAVSMGRHTVNAGKVYCAAGSLDCGDVLDGRADIDLNMRREVKEETGLDLAAAEAEGGYYALHIDRVFTVVRIFRMAASAAELMERIAAHVASEPEPEIEGAVAIFGPDASAHSYMPFMPPVLDWFFAREKG
ncbi:NUDIX hydrolase [Sinorhizobium sp. BG8]|uniref:NUDIX hydrolase n=1 Tax=Sinorhizobium sp. BG8 TaxID=2613773 RepID=UPI00193D0015|nr:NUDIX hydrolase [Sinorhizobium sp. BG8]QRM55865.1 NUDIX hydrolase [Sinorhizobium sp. BG8]